MLQLLRVAPHAMAKAIRGRAWNTAASDATMLGPAKRGAPTTSPLVSHYEERLTRDLDWIHELVGIVGQSILKALSDAVRSVLEVNKDLAAMTVIGDYTTNRQTRELDRLCHAFVARHLPSAGHLRSVSAVLRLSISLERIGDYATTISRTAVQLSTPPPTVVTRDIQMMAEQASRLLSDALRSFRQREVQLAQDTRANASQFARYFDRVFADLAQEGEANSRPAAELFALMATFNRLERVIHQAKNICEETIFVVTGKPPRAKRPTASCSSTPTTAAPANWPGTSPRKAFPNSGDYDSCRHRAGRRDRPGLPRVSRRPSAST